MLGERFPPGTPGSIRGRNSTPNEGTPKESSSECLRRLISGCKSLASAILDRKEAARRDIGSSFERLRRAVDAAAAFYEEELKCFCSERLQELDDYENILKEASKELERKPQSDGDGWSLARARQAYFEWLLRHLERRSLNFGYSANGDDCLEPSAVGYFRRFQAGPDDAFVWMANTDEQRVTRVSSFDRTMFVWLHFKSTYYEPLLIGFLSVRVLDDRGDDLKVKVYDNMDGYYYALFAPKGPGVHKLLVSLYGHLVTGSPFRIEVGAGSSPDSEDVFPDEGVLPAKEISVASLSASDGDGNGSGNGSGSGSGGGSGAGGQEVETDEDNEEEEEVEKVESGVDADVVRADDSADTGTSDPAPPPESDRGTARTVRSDPDFSSLRWGDAMELLEDSGTLVPEDDGQSLDDVFEPREARKPKRFTARLVETLCQGEGVYYPAGLASHQGHLLVCGSQEGVVKIYRERDDKLVGTLQRKDRHLENRMQGPSTLLVKDGLVFVKDVKAVNVFDFETRAFLGTVGTRGLTEPHGLCWSGDNRLVVVEHIADQPTLCLFQPLAYDGSGQQSYERCALRPLYPAGSCEGLVVRSRCRHLESRDGERMFVSDFGTNKVYAANKKGEIEFQIGSPGRSGTGRFDQPSGMTSDGDGNLLVSDSRNDRIQVFDECGSALGILETREGDLRRPSDIFLSRVSNRLYVSDPFGHRVKVFQLQ